jgi:hypothetical protein
MLRQPAFSNAEMQKPFWGEDQSAQVFVVCRLQARKGSKQVLPSVPFK